MFWNKKRTEDDRREEIKRVKNPADLRVTYVGFRDKPDILLDITTDQSDEESVVSLAKMISTIFTTKTQALTIETIKRGLILNERYDLVETFVNEVIRQASNDFDNAKNEAYFTEPCVKPSDVARQGKYE